MAAEALEHIDHRLFRDVLGHFASGIAVIPAMDGDAPGVNILAEDQEDVCRQMASRVPDKWSGVGWTPGPGGNPRLDGTLAYIDCTLEAEHDGGDHHLVLGRVGGLEARADAAPLVFFRGSYARLSA